MGEHKVFDVTELESCGAYPVVGKNYDMDQYPVEKYDTPMTPKENWERFLAHGEYSWVPDVYVDLNVVCPDFVPDNIADGFAGGIDSFGVKWVPVESNETLPAFVDPGFKLLSSVDEWHSLTIPDVDSWDWDEGGRPYREGLDFSRPTVAIIQTGLFERMVSVLGFEDAAVSFLDSPDETSELLDAIADFDISLLEHYRKYCACDTVIFHDDWGSKMNTFFSPDILRGFIIPRIRRIVARAHELGMAFIMHSCGNVTSFVPYMIEAGVDVWQFNDTAVMDTIFETIDTYGDRIAFHGYFERYDAPLDDAEAFKAEVRKYFDDFGRTGHCAISICDYADRGIDTPRYSYECARRCADRLFA